MAGPTRSSASEKLELGLKRLQTSGDDRDSLGLALTALHGALEDFLRVWLHDHPGVALDVKINALERSAYTWRELRAAVEQFAEPTPFRDRLLELIAVMNRMRQEVAHGGEYEGTREQLVEYGRLVQDTLHDGLKVITLPMSPLAIRRDPTGAARLQEQRLGRLEREWRAKLSERPEWRRNREPPSIVGSMCWGILSVVAGICVLLLLNSQLGTLLGVGVAMLLLLGTFFSHAGAVAYHNAYKRAHQKYQERRAAVLGGALLDE